MFAAYCFCFLPFFPALFAVFAVCGSLFDGCCLLLSVCAVRCVLVVLVL